MIASKWKPEMLTNSILNSNLAKFYFIKSDVLKINMDRYPGAQRTALFFTHGNNQRIQTT
jgi:hypothetical protein